MLRMLTVDEYGRIRRAQRDGMSIREIAREFHHSRYKVRAVLRSGGEPQDYRRREIQNFPRARQRGTATGHGIIVSSGTANSRFLLTAKRKMPLVNSGSRHGGTEFSSAEVTASPQSTWPPRRILPASAAANRTHRSLNNGEHSARRATVGSGQEVTGYTVASNSRVSWRVR